MTALEMVNAVLRRLRLSSVSDFTGEHTLLMVDFINETKSEVERALGWVDQRESALVTTVAGTPSYQLLDLRQNMLIYQVYNDTKDYELTQKSVEELNKLFLGQSAGYQAEPLYWGINGRSSGEVTIDLWPTPNSADSIVFYIKSNPQAPITSTTDEFLAPADVILLGAIAKALADRGDASDAEIARADSRYQLALADAVAAEAQNLGKEDYNLEPV